MARVTGCWGAEYAASGVDGSSFVDGPTFQALSARTGNYGINSKATSAVNVNGVSLKRPDLGVSFIGPGVQFDFRFRCHFRPVTFPSANNLQIASIQHGNSQTPTIALQMNTSGQVRMVGNGISTSYANGLTLNTWYRCDLRIYGFGVTNDPPGTNAINYSIDLYADDGTLIATLGPGGSFLSSGGNIVPPDQLAMGQVTIDDGPSCTREIDYDDAFLDFAIGADAPIAAWPRATKVYPFGVTGQGSFDQFTPAGAYGNVDDIPPLTGGFNDFVSSSTAGNKTTYTHAALPVSTDEVECISVGATASTGGFVTLLIGTDEFTNLFPNADNGIRAGKHYIGATLSAASFAALEFGGRVISSFFQLSAILMEVLAGPPPLTVNAGPDQAITAGFTTLAGSGSPGSATFVWTQISGPTTAIFDDATNPTTDVFGIFTGTYVFRLTGTLGALTQSDDVSITVDYNEVEFGDEEQAGSTIGISWNTLAPRPSTALRALEQLDAAIAVHEADDFLIVTLNDGDRSLAQYLRVDELRDPAKVRTQILATLRQLRESTAITMPPNGGERFRLQAAYHEAGHAIMALSVGVGVRSCSIVPGAFGKIVFGGQTFYDLPFPDPAPHRTLLSHAVILRVGPLTPTVLLGHPREQFDGADQRQIDSILKVLNVADPEAARDGLHAMARAFLHEPLHGSQIEAVACGLLERRTLSGHQIREICAGNGLPLTPWQMPPIEKLASQLVEVEIGGDQNSVISRLK